MSNEIKKRIRIDDVALKAGVSTATVSYVINGTRHINEDTAKRVRQAILELNYQPNMAARSLMTKSTHIIGVLVSDISNPFFSPIVRGIEDLANQAGYVVMVGNSDEKYSKAEQYVDILARHRVDGLIISPTSGFEKLKTSLDNLNIPTVLVNRRLDELDVDTVVTDNEMGAYIGVRHLLSYGHKNIGLIIGPTSVSTYNERLEGYKRALKESGIPLNEQLIKIGGYDYESGYQATCELINKTANLSSIFVGSSRLAQGAFYAIKRSKIKVPQELSLLMFDETEWAPLVSPPLTTLAQRTYEMGKISAAILLKKLGGQHEDILEDYQRDDSIKIELKGSIFDIKLKPKLLIRESTIQV